MTAECSYKLYTHNTTNVQCQFLLAIIPNSTFHDLPLVEGRIWNYVAFWCMGHAICNWPGMRVTKVVINVGRAQLLTHVKGGLYLSSAMYRFWQVFNSLVSIVHETRTDTCRGHSEDCTRPFSFGLVVVHSKLCLWPASVSTFSLTPPYQTGAYLVKETGDNTVRLLCTLFGSLFCLFPPKVRISQGYISEHLTNR